MDFFSLFALEKKPWAKYADRKQILHYFLDLLVLWACEQIEDFQADNGRLFEIGGIVCDKG